MKRKSMPVLFSFFSLFSSFFLFPFEPFVSIFCSIFGRQEERKSNEAADGMDADSDEQFKLMQALVIDKLQEDTKINNKEKGELQGETKIKKKEKGEIQEDTKINN